MPDPNCLDGGYLCGTDVLLPADKSAHYQIADKLVGCNRLYCNICGSWVKVFSGVRPWGGTKTDEEQLRYYDSENPDEWPFLHRGGGGEMFRTYRCRCDHQFTSGFKQVSEMDIGWRCAGHPQP